MQGVCGLAALRSLVTMVVAAVVGYWAIAFLIRVLGKVGLAPFGIYCVAAGTISVIIL